jgi:hypothetical protein
MRLITLKHHDLVLLTLFLMLLWLLFLASATSGSW